MDSKRMMVHVGCGSPTNRHKEGTLDYEYCPKCDSGHHVGSDGSVALGVVAVEVVGRSHIPTQFAISCRRHGYVFLTYDAWWEQANDPTSEGYSCPICFAAMLYEEAAKAEFDDDNFVKRESV